MFWNQSVWHWTKHRNMDMSRMSQQLQVRATSSKKHPSFFERQHNQFCRGVNRRESIGILLESKFDFLLRCVFSDVFWGPWANIMQNHYWNHPKRVFLDTKRNNPQIANFGRALGPSGEAKPSGENAPFSCEYIFTSKSMSLIKYDGFSTSLRHFGRFREKLLCLPWKLAQEVPSAP